MWVFQIKVQVFKATSVYRNHATLYKGTPTPGPQTGTSPWPFRNRAAQQEVNGRQGSETSSVSAAALQR